MAREAAQHLSNMYTAAERTLHRGIALTLGYLGTRFAGWAAQRPDRTAGRPTIESILQDALRNVFGSAPRLVVAGRTDAGVHAEGQVVSFSIDSPIPVAGLLRALNVVLPTDIWIVDVREVPGGFHARRSALRRWYRYHVWEGPGLPTHWRGRCLVHPDVLDAGAMREAARRMVGRFDARALASGWKRDERPGRSTVRTLYAVDWLRGPEPPLLTLEVCGNAFLRQMVRTLAGCFLAVGEGRWSPDEFEAAIQSADRRRAAASAPAAGLTLWKIEYPSAFL